MFDDEALTDVSALIDPVTTYDCVDLAAGVGALQLLPENADQLGRLEIAAGAISSLPFDQSRPQMAAPRWRRWLNGPVLGGQDIVSGEDRCDHLFTEAFTFHGGSYIVLPGLFEEATYITRHLTRALFLSNIRTLDTEFVNRAGRLYASILALSDAVAQRSGLRRGLPPIHRSGNSVLVPSSERFDLLKRAVTFSLDDLTRLLGPLGLDIDAFEDLVATPGDGTVANCIGDKNPIFSRPVLRHGEVFTVVAPSCLLVAARHAVLVRAALAGLMRELADKFRGAVYRDVENSLKLLESRPVADLPPRVDGGPPLVENFFGLDRDKVLHLVLLTDELEDYDPEHVYGEWPIGAAGDQIDSRLVQARTDLFDRFREINEVVHLVVTQGVGRSMALGLAGSGPPVEDAATLLLNASDLEVIALAEGGKPLVLRQYARAADSIRDKAAVMAIAPLDEFATYRSSAFSYYLSDEAIPSMIVVSPGSAEPLRMEVQRERDFHAVQYPDDDAVVDVTLLHDDPAYPLYFPLRAPNDAVSLLIESLPLPIWIVGPPGSRDGEDAQLYSMLAEMLGFWLLRLSPILIEALAVVISEYERVQLHLELRSSQEWLKANRDATDATLSCEDTGGGRLRLRLGPGVASLLEGPDNAGEREIMRAVLGGISSLLVNTVQRSLESLVGTPQDEVLDQYVPLGQQKTVFFLNGDDNPQLDSRALPGYRPVQPAEESVVLNDIGQHLSATRRLAVGPIPDDQRTGVLRDVVGFLFTELERLTATVRADELLGWLIAFHERLVYERSMRRLTLVTRMACFGPISGFSGYIAELQTEIQGVSKASATCRFLIEYVTARPPRGIRPFSVSLYDRLMALASDIINFGLESDLIHFNLADYKFAMLPSGRLGANRQAYHAVRNQFAGVFTAGEVDRSAAELPRYWRRREQIDEPDVIDRLDSATRAEFGSTASDILAFIREVAMVGSRQADATKRASVDKLIATVVSELEWDHPRGRAVFDLLAAGARDQFLDPPGPHARDAVYPWRFNRSLSYLRKPLLVHGPDRDQVIWGNRHLFDAGRYLVDLCVGGRLKATSKEMKQYITLMQQAEAEAFNDAVAEVFECDPNFIVRRRVNKVAGERIQRTSKQSLGDIDVLVADRQRRRLLAIEAKDLAVARTPAELANELESTFQTRGSRPAAVDRHLERTEWLRRNLRQTLAWLGIDDSKGWKVSPLVVVDQELMSPFLIDPKVPVVVFRDLRARIQSV